MADSVSSGAAAPPVLDASSVANSTSSFWDRLTAWASENKATVYTIAGVTLVATGAGVYYYTSSGTPTAAASEKKKSRKSNKKAKKDAEKGEADKKAPTEGT